MGRQSGERSGLEPFIQFEKIAKILCGLRSDGLDRYPAKFSDLAGDFDYEHGLVALATMGNRCEVRGVGLDQHSIE